ncbi:hypothetical protein [Spongiibacter sp. IMCC21906]|nr:hypothetical protein [Spongiibacter sp. IMCC21906]
MRLAIKTAASLWLPSLLAILIGDTAEPESATFDDPAQSIKTLAWLQLI